MSQRHAVCKHLVELLLPVADALNCRNYLEHVNKMVRSRSGADRQLAALEETGDAAEAVRMMTEMSRIKPPAGAPLSGSN